MADRDEKQVAAWACVGGIAAEAVQLQTSWLSQMGLSWAIARAMDEQAREALKAAWAAHYRAVTAQ